MDPCRPSAPSLLVDRSGADDGDKFIVSVFAAPNLNASQLIHSLAQRIEGGGGQHERPCPGGLNSKYVDFVHVGGTRNYDIKQRVRIFDAQATTGGNMNGLCEGLLRSQMGVFVFSLVKPSSLDWLKEFILGWYFYAAAASPLHCCRKQTSPMNLSKLLKLRGA